MVLQPLFWIGRVRKAQFQGMRTTRQDGQGAAEAKRSDPIVPWVSRVPGSRIRIFNSWDCPIQRVNSGPGATAVVAG